MAVNVRVENKFFYGGNRGNDRDRLLKQFKRAVDESGILQELKEREYHQTKSRKRRKQEKQSALTRKYNALAEAELKKQNRRGMSEE